MREYKVATDKLAQLSAESRRLDELLVMNPLRAAILASLKADLQYAAQVIARMIQVAKSPYMPSQQIQTFPPIIIKWANAIKQWEGSIDATNPGNMKYAPLTASWGASRGRYAKDGGAFAVFRSPAAGFTALCNFLVLACHDELKSYHQARTLREFTVVYAGNPPEGYIQGIIRGVGVSGDTDIGTFV